METHLNGDDVNSGGNKMQRSAPARANRELVRLLYLEHGHQKASELSGVRYDLVRQWACRYGWTQPRTEALSQNVTRQVADRVQDELADNERETRLSLSRYAKRAAKDAEGASLKDAPYVKSAAQVAGIVHKWDSDSSKGNHFTLNTLNINSLVVDGTTDQ